jgi:hypothetical protein
MENFNYAFFALLIVVLISSIIFSLIRQRRLIRQQNAKKIDEKMYFFLEFYARDTTLEDLYDHADRIVDSIITGKFSPEEKRRSLKKLEDYMNLHVLYRIREMKNISDLYHAIWSFRPKKTIGYRDFVNPRYREVKDAVENKICFIFSDSRMHFAEALAQSHEEIIKLFLSWFDHFSEEQFKYNPLYLIALYWIDAELSAFSRWLSPDFASNLSSMIEEIQHIKKVLLKQDATNKPNEEEWAW